MLVAISPFLKHEMSWFLHWPFFRTSMVQVGVVDAFICLQPSPWTMSTFLAIISVCNVHGWPWSTNNRSEDSSSDYYDYDCMGAGLYLRGSSTSTSTVNIASSYITGNYISKSSDSNSALGGGIYASNLNSMRISSTEFALNSLTLDGDSGNNGGGITNITISFCCWW